MSWPPGSMRSRSAWRRALPLLPTPYASWTLRSRRSRGSRRNSRPSGPLVARHPLRHPLRPRQPNSQPRTPKQPLRNPQGLFAGLVACGDRTGSVEACRVRRPAAGWRNTMGRVGSAERAGVGTHCRETCVGARRRGSMRRVTSRPVERRDGRSTSEIRSVARRAYCPGAAVRSVDTSGAVIRGVQRCSVMRPVETRHDSNRHGQSWGKTGHGQPRIILSSAEIGNTRVHH
jgi:hypothetical protein